MIQTQRPYTPMYMQRPPGVETVPGAHNTGPGGPPVPGPVGPIGPAGLGPGGGPLPTATPAQFRRWTLLDGTKL